MREIHRTIVAALIFSSDNKLLMGKKDPAKGGVYSDCWHIPGGGINENESLDDALIREVREEVGIDIIPYGREFINDIGTGVSEKILPGGEKVLCHMKFNLFKVFIDKTADQIKIHLGDDLIETRWFSKIELRDVKQIPGGKEFFVKHGFIS